MKPIFARGPSLNVRLGLALMASLALMVLDHRYQHLEAVRAGLATVVAPLQFLVNLPGRWLGAASDSLETRESLESQVQKLSDENTILKAQVQTLVALEAENERLRGLLGAARKGGERRLVAEIVDLDRDPFSHQLLISKGTRDGVYLGQPVLDADGVMGQIVEANPLTSRVLLISDASHALPVRAVRSGVRAIAAGSGNLGWLVLEHVPSTADIKAGDVLVSSSLGQRFPEGYPVGTVREVVQDPGETFLKIFVTPSAKLDRASQVLLVWPRFEIPSLPAPAAAPQPEAVKSDTAKPVAKPDAAQSEAARSPETRP
ncbi:MAG: rod shape-determining protein MreC [Gammaproteobacteria bacterium]|nr:rod shape-determining protein MreC [Gammaproteobacteria bacterium]